MASKEEYIENIVQGMKKNKRSLVQRYGNEAEEMIYKVANQKWEEKMKKELKEGSEKFVLKMKSKNKRDTVEITLDSKERYDKILSRYKAKGWSLIEDKPSLKETILKVYKQILKEQNEVVDSKSFIENKSIKEDVRELTDEEFKIAKTFATKQGGKLASTGADDKFMYLGITLPGSTEEVEFKIDKQGNEIKEGFQGDEPIGDGLSGFRGTDSPENTPSKYAKNPEADKKVKLLLNNLVKWAAISENEAAELIRTSLKRLGF